jgi:hypothetical protein
MVHFFETSANQALQRRAYGAVPPGRNTIFARNDCLVLPMQFELATPGASANPSKIGRAGHGDGRSVLRTFVGAPVHCIPMQAMKLSMVVADETGLAHERFAPGRESQRKRFSAALAVWNTRSSAGIRMLFPGKIVSLAYDLPSRRLTISFDTMRTIVFYGVPLVVKEELADSNTLDEAFVAHVFGKYAWTEIGAFVLPDPGRSD